MTDFSLTSLLSNYIICIYVQKKICLSFFYCVCFFSLPRIQCIHLIHPSISLALIHFYCFASILLSHQMFCEREKKQLSQRCIVFIFAFRSPFLSRSLSVFLLFFLLPYGTIYHILFKLFKCTMFRHVHRFHTVPLVALKQELPSQIRKTGSINTYNLNW